MKVSVPLSAALIIAGPAAAQSSHAKHHPAVKPPTTTMPAGKGCPKISEMSGNMEHMKQMHQQMTGEMQQHRSMGTAMQKSAPPADDKPH